MIDSEKRYNIFTRDVFTCQRKGCNKSKGKFGKVILSLAHRIKNGSGSIKHIKKYIYSTYKIHLNSKQCQDILDDEENLVTACVGYCNDHFNIFFKPVERDALIDKIYKKLNT